MKTAKVCDNIILFSLYVIAFFLPVSKGAIESFSILAIVAYLVKKFSALEDLPKSPLNLGIFAYLSVCVFSIFFSANIGISSRTFFFKTLQNAAFFFAVFETLNEKKRIRNVLNVLFLSSLVLGIDGIYQHFTRQDFLRHRPVIFIVRIYASFATPNAFGCYLAMVIPFLISRFFSKFKLKTSRFIYFALFVLLFTCLLLTVSRGAWLAYLTSVLFMSIWVRALAVFLLVLGIFILATYVFYPPYLKERLAKFFFFSDTIDIDRKFIWQAGWKMFVARPWIGLGLGTFMFNFKKFIAEDYKYTASYAHNCYLQMASELGVIGLLAFLSILGLFFYHGIKALNKGERNFYWYILLASQAAIFGYCVQMGVDTTLYTLDLGMLFWLVLGMGTAAMRNMEKAAIR
ncbi:MAG: O-antigen ligase family protein [Candidatus Omnitrophota bacterium]|nr:O-antigen ligase family protein [Candidatus Omnitrophota bacterium]